MQPIQMADRCTQTVVSNVHGLDHLHADVFGLVFELVSGAGPRQTLHDLPGKQQLLKAFPWTLPAVSRVCRLFHELVNPIIYRDFVLGTSWQTGSNLEEIVIRILDNTSKVRSYVFNVSVGTSVNIKLLETALSCLTGLESLVFRDFSWEGCYSRP